MEARLAEQRGLAPLGVYRGIAVAGCPPGEMGIGPLYAIPKLLKQHGLAVHDFGLWKLNEAFAGQALYCHDRLGIDPAQYNVNGGGIAIGHPYGMTGARLVGHALLTNNFALPAATICALYKARWQVELFFKWIKQHLRIKKFYGNSENAVKSQIWIAVSVYGIKAIVKRRLNLDASLYTLLQILSVTLCEKMPLQQSFPGSDYKMPDRVPCNQLSGRLDR